MGERRRRASAVAGGDGRGEEKAAAPAPAPAPTVWFALKKSLQCRSQSSEVHVPKPKASSSAGAGAGGHLSSIVTKRAARSGCSRSIANLRDVIHGSKRHPGQPPSCSPRSIGSSEFLNPIAHEVVLSTNSRCELKITGFGGCGGLGAGGGGPAHEAEGGDGGGVVSSFVGTLRPGTPGPGWSHGLQYSGSCRAGSMRCTPPRSPNPLLDRDGAAAAGAAHRASCEADAAKTGGKGSGGLSCHRCTEQFSKWEALEAHHLSKHADLEESVGNNEEMGDLGSGTSMGQDNTPDLFDLGIPIPNSGGVTSLGKIFAGEVDQSLLSKLNLDDYKAPGEPSPYTSPPRSPPGGIKHCLLSPVTPLDLLGSPTQPWKKLRGVVEELGVVKTDEGHEKNVPSYMLEA